MEKFEGFLDVTMKEYIILQDTSSEVTQDNENSFIRNAPRKYVI